MFLKIVITLESISTFLVSVDDLFNTFVTSQFLTLLMAYLGTMSVFPSSGSWRGTQVEGLSHRCGVKLKVVWSLTWGQNSGDARVLVTSLGVTSVHGYFVLGTYLLVL